MKKNGVKKKKNNEEDSFWDKIDIDDFLKDSMENIMDYFDFSKKNSFKDIKFPVGNDLKDKKIGYSISYKYGTGMDKPKISVNGNPVDIEDFKDIFGDIPQFGLNASDDQKLILDAKSLQLSENDSDYETRYEEPIYEIFDESNEGSICIILELPGATIENIVVSYYDDEVVIMGDTNDRIYRKELTLDFVPDKQKTQVLGKNGIYQIQFSK